MLTGIRHIYFLKKVPSSFILISIKEIRYLAVSEPVLARFSSWVLSALQKQHGGSNHQIALGYYSKGN